MPMMGMGQISFIEEMRPICCKLFDIGKKSMPSTVKKYFFSISVIQIFLLLLVGGLTACQNSDNALADVLPLDEQKPTFIFFYTDG